MIFDNVFLAIWGDYVPDDQWQAVLQKFEKWGEKEPHMKPMCGCEDKGLT